MRKYGSGQVLRDEDGEPVQKTAAVRPLTPQEVRRIETEDQQEE